MMTNLYKITNCEQKRILFWLWLTIRIVIFILKIVQAENWHYNFSHKFKMVRVIFVMDFIRRMPAGTFGLDIKIEQLQIGCGSIREMCVKQIGQFVECCNFIESKKVSEMTTD